MKYKFAEHTHRYALWAAARAVNRDFAKTVAIKQAVENSGMLQDYVLNPFYERKEFEVWQKEAANELIGEFESQGISCSFGRAAKIIAIYLKTALVIRLEPNDPRSMVIHPPIDRVLLFNLAKLLKNQFAAHAGIKQDFLKITSTTLSEDEYRELIRLLDTIGAPVN